MAHLVTNQSILDSCYIAYSLTTNLVWLGIRFSAKCWPVLKTPVGARMTLIACRVVKIHDEDSKSVFGSKEIMTNLHKLLASKCQKLIWETSDTPPALDDPNDPARETLEIEPPRQGSIFPILELMPGKFPSQFYHLHRQLHHLHVWRMRDCYG